MTYLLRIMLSITVIIGVKIVNTYIYYILYVLYIYIVTSNDFIFAFRVLL